MIEILYQDENFVAVNKPIGINTILGRDNQVEQAHEQVLLKMVEKQQEKNLYVVHRLDKPVSGLVVFAKHALAHKHLNEQFAKGQVVKKYLALVHGSIKNNNASIDKPIREYGSGRMGVDLKKGKPSLTFYEVKERVDKYTLVSVYPKTGRRHQLRVHLYSIGHPIVGDLQYGDTSISLGYPRLMLHSEQIVFFDLVGKEIKVVCNLKESFLSLVKNI